MFQLGFGFGVDNSKQGMFEDGFRSLFSVIDGLVYTVLDIIYEVLFNIADSPIIQSTTIKTFYSRIELIIGIFMIFKLSVSLLQVIINPDLLSDKKRGFGQIITRIIIMLVMFAAIRPLNIPNAEPGSYNAYLNQHGILFGTMYSLQSRIIKTGVIPELILGKSQDGVSTSGTGIDSDSEGKRLSMFLMKKFVTINLKDADTEMVESNYMVPPDKLTSGSFLSTDYSDVYEIYNSSDITPMDFHNIINATDGKKYAFSYFPIVPSICGIIIIFILGSFCIDVAIRTLKLAILKLISPIPIISYIDPKSAEKGAFATWVKMLISTFLNLFIILFCVHFAIFIIGEIIPINGGGVAITFSDNIIVNTFTIVFLIIGILFFARMLPKFIMDALGIKGIGLGPGLSGLLGATGALFSGGGLSGAAAGFMMSANNAVEAAATGKQAPFAISTGSDLAAKISTGDPNAKGGLLNAFERKALNFAANRHGFNSAIDDKSFFGAESEAARVHINELKSNIASEENKLSDLRKEQSDNLSQIQNYKDMLSNNFSENMKNRINELRRSGLTDADIDTIMVNEGYTNEDLGQYFGIERAISIYASKDADFKTDISNLEGVLNNYRNELRNTEIYKGEAEFNKGKSQEAIDKMQKIYKNIGNASHKGDGAYSARGRGTRPW